MDRLSDHDEEAFAEIVSRIADPDLRRVRSMVLVAAAPILLVFSAGIVLVGLGWEGMIAFWASFLSGLLVGWPLLSRRHRRQLAAAWQQASGS